MATDTTIAKTIISQLGGRKFTVATGSKDFIALEDGIRFSLGRNKTSANRCEIKLNGKDLYDVRFYRQTMSKKTFEIKCKDHKVYNDIYCDMLQEIFEGFTGMYIQIF